LELAVSLYQIRLRLIRSLKRVLAHLWEDSELRNALVSLYQG